MPPPFSWIKPEPWGIHVVPAEAWIDPSRPVERALVTHGHADHARGGHGQTVATPETLAILRKHDTPTICNALEHVMGGRTAEGFTKTPVVCADVALPPIVGFARTARIRASSPAPH